VELRKQSDKLKRDLKASNETNEILLAEMNKLDAELVLNCVKCMYRFVVIAPYIGTRSCKRSTIVKRRLQGTHVKRCVSYNANNIL